MTLMVLFQIGPDNTEENKALLNYLNHHLLHNYH